MRTRPSTGLAGSTVSKGSGACKPHHLSSVPASIQAATPKRETSIETYRSKRDFAVTSEPAPCVPEPSAHAPLFVVQKHAARRAGLHWDFRLEHGGVLWSWAVRKGPSLDPKDRRLAAHVEDHPLDYADFQGTIP